MTSKLENYRIYGVDLLDGTRIDRFDLVRVAGRQRLWRFMYQHENGDVTVFGPVSDDGRTRKDSKHRSFKLELVSKA